MLPIYVKYIGCIYPRSAWLYPFLFLSRATGRAAGPILTLDGTFAADSAKEMPVEGGENRKNFKSQISPKLKKFLIIAQA
jgi:hypothetical protein